VQLLSLKSRLIQVWVVTALFQSIPAHSQDLENIIPFDQAYKRTYHAKRLLGTPPVIDGKLKDTCWMNEGEWSQNFLQNTPVERAQPTFPTRIKILYDNKNIYFALCAWDTQPDKINRFVGNRDDNSIGDLISVAFDTYHDFRAAPEFNINAGGNKTDLIVTDNLSVNLNWNAVWEGKTTVNDSSWTVEFRIPFNQLRYNQTDSNMIWGLHVRRIIRRIQEVDQWSLIPRKNSGHVYSFGMLVGLEGVPKSKLVEFLPYFAGKVTSEPAIPGSPYSKNIRWNGNAGIDSKIGVGDFTMDITINPDFGQVEADPSVMNLTALETFYDEKRPFFLEGKHIFDFSADNNLMFYSRRIGHVPSYSPEVDNVTSFSKNPEFTNIIDAVKLTGTTRNGISVGILQSTTRQERAHLTEDGVETRPVVEPLTNYLIGRVQKAAGKGNTQFGIMFTSTNRFINDPQLDFLNRNAYTAGIDFLHYTKNREYFIDFRGLGSHITGKKEAIVDLQRNAQHYYQRPDVSDYLGVDSSRRSLSGTGGYLSVGRQGDKRFIFSEIISWWSPGFDLNDIGYFLMADVVENQTNMGIRQTQPKWLLRNYTLTIGQKNSWNYGGLNAYNDLSVKFITQFSNRIDLSITESYVFSELETRLLRGGPAFRLTSYWENTILFNTNKSNRVIFTLKNNGIVSNDGVSRLYSIQPALNFRLGNHIYIISDFKYTNNTDNFLYVTQEKVNDELKYIMARIKQRTYSFTLRFNYNITPDISIQYYGSPFISIGTYSDFKRTANTQAGNLEDRYHSYNDTEILVDQNLKTYSVNEGTASYTFSNPDFSFRQFRSNLVARWEYRPGSTIYLVWENNRNSMESDYISSFSHNLNNLFKVQPTNVFMVKISFWLGI
jgi:hypothetical protein